MDEIIEIRYEDVRPNLGMTTLFGMLSTVCIVLSLGILGFGGIDNGWNGLTFISGLVLLTVLFALPASFFILALGYQSKIASQRSRAFKIGLVLLALWAATTLSSLAYIFISNSK